MLRVAAAAVAPSSKAAKRIHVRPRPASTPHSSHPTSNANVLVSDCYRHLSYVRNRIGRVEVPKGYPCIRCMSTTADIEGLLGSRPSNVRSNNNKDKRRSDRDNKNRAYSHQQRILSSKGEQNFQDQKQRWKHKSKGSTKQTVQASDGVGTAAGTAAVAARALPDKTALLLPRATERMEAFLQRRALLPSPPAAWLQRTDGSHFRDLVDDESENDEMLAQRIALHNDVVQLLLILRDSILGGHISPRGGRNGLILSDLLGNILLLLGESPPSHPTSVRSAGVGNQNTKRAMSPADAAAIGLDLLRRTNLDVRPDHFASAIRAACHDERWKMASDLFSSQVNPDSAGLVPVDAALGLDSAAELGLYAIARHSQAEYKGNSGGPSVADKVFDAALGMSIISPTDQDNCEYYFSCLSIYSSYDRRQCRVLTKSKYCLCFTFISRCIGSRVGARKSG
jgi:hypothetical protein